MFASEPASAVGRPLWSAKLLRQLIASPLLGSRLARPPVVVLKSTCGAFLAAGRVSGWDLDYRQIDSHLAATLSASLDHTVAPRHLKRHGGGQSLAENSIGLHIYTIRVRRNRKRSGWVPLGDDGDQGALANYSEIFLHRNSAAVQGVEGVGRSWYVETVEGTEGSFHGLMRYGSTGFTEEIRDRETRRVQYNRLSSDIGTIPLYYRIRIPERGTYGLLGLQTFGNRSCVARFQNAFTHGFRAVRPDLMLEFTPVLPHEVARFADGAVKVFSMTKRDYSSDKTDNQIGSQVNPIDLDVTFRAKRRSSLGNLRQYVDRIARRGESKVLEYNDEQFDEAVAEVMVGRKRRRVVLVGVNRGAGKFDLTGDVVISNGHPKFESIAAECEEIFVSILDGDS